MTISLSSFSSHDFIYFEQNTQMSLLNEMKPRIQGSVGSTVDLSPSLTRTGLHLPVSLLSSAGVPALRGKGAAAPLPSASLGQLGWGRKWQTEDASLLLCGCVQTTPPCRQLLQPDRVACFCAADRCQDQRQRHDANSDAKRRKSVLHPGPGFTVVFADPARHFSRILMKTFLDRDECQGAFIKAISEHRRPRFSVGCGASSQGCGLASVKGKPHFTFSAPSACAAGCIFILQDNTMFWWRVNTQGSHFQGEDMRTLAQGKLYVLTAFIFLFFLFPL